MSQQGGQARQAAAAEPAARRSFLRRAVGALVGTPLAVGFTALVATHILWLLGCFRFLFPNVRVEPPTRFKVGYPGIVRSGSSGDEVQGPVWRVDCAP